MKKNRIFALLLVSLTASAALAGCQSEPPASEPSAESESSVSAPASTPESSAPSEQAEAGLPELTAEQKLEEFDLLCTILDEGYPFWHDVAELGIDKEQIYQQYRDAIPETADTYAYLNTLKSFLREFNYSGHLTAITPSNYQSTLDIYDIENGNAKDHFLYDALTSPVSASAYSKLDPTRSDFFPAIQAVKTENSEGESSGQSTSASSVTSLLQSSILEDGTAYLKIPSFATQYYRIDGPAIAAFFEEIQDTENLIIDIRGNGGGNSGYWRQYLVWPNAKEDLSSSRYYLYKINDWTIDYTETCGVELYDISSLPESFQAEGFTHYAVSQINFEKAENPYSGRIWVLVDRSVYSASEEFATFCKNTGFATLVGSATGGDDPLIDPMVVSLPTSGFLFKMSTFYGLNADGTSNELEGTKPDILITPKEDALDVCLAAIHGES